MKHRPRILLADDHTMLLEAFRRLIEPRCEIVGVAGDGRALLELAASTRPEIIVLDVSMLVLIGMDNCSSPADDAGSEVRLPHGERRSRCRGGGDPAQARQVTS